MNCLYTFTRKVVTARALELLLYLKSVSFYKEYELSALIVIKKSTKCEYIEITEKICALGLE